MKGMVRRLRMVVFFDSETSLVMPVSDLDKVVVHLETAVLRGLMAATVAYSAINAAVHKGEVRLVVRS